MSKIKNEPKITFSLIQAVRGQMEQRAQWLYLLCDEAGKRGLDWPMKTAAITVPAS